MSNHQTNDPDDNPIAGTDSDPKAADLIRQKLNRIYNIEPDAATEETEITKSGAHSKHQKFMQDLMSSGKDIATVQTEWHNYYLNLNDVEKQKVWQEFYSSNQNLSKAEKPEVPTQGLAELKNQVITSKKYQPKTVPASDKPRPSRITKTIRDTVSNNGQLKAKHHIQSLLFGLGLGTIVIVIFLFSFFNEIIIAPFIQPSRDVAATPVIIGDSTVAPTTTPEVIIPKINVQIPVDYSETSTNENTIENDLEAGVVHYPTTVEPGQTGNAAFFGHSSNNIFNPGKYKFAFVLLHTIVNGDTFYLTYNHTVYIYKVISTTIVSPSDVAVLGPVSGQTATATLITCDPPGTSINRLVVVGQQISPDPTTNTAPVAKVVTATTPSVLPGNGPTLWTRVIDSPEGKIIAVTIGLVVVVIIFRRVTKPAR